jgi:hypothetical protein
LPPPFSRLPFLCFVACLVSGLVPRPLDVYLLGAICSRYTGFVSGARDEIAQTYGLTTATLRGAEAYPPSPAMQMFDEDDHNGDEWF